MKKICEIFIWEDFFRFIEPRVRFKHQVRLFSSQVPLDRDTEIFFSIGGDGTMLDSVRIIKDSEIPVIGINLGRLGFLSSVSRAEIIPALNSVLQRKFHIVKRSLIKLQEPSNLFENGNFAVNEVSINKINHASMVVVHVWVNDILLNSYWADGVIIATPTGSTAYSLSCGGPIITPDSQNFVITPIAPHSLSVTSVVIPDNCTIRVKIDSRDNQALVSLDSLSAVITPETELVIKKAEFGINLIECINDSFFSTLRSKLNWGIDKRN